MELATTLLALHYFKTNKMLTRCSFRREVNENAKLIIQPKINSFKKNYLLSL